jgi:hypothetical protein
MKHARWRVNGLHDPRDPTLPRAVFACRLNESPWRVVWQHRGEIPGRLSEWFKRLAADGVEPLERVLLGTGAALTEWTAHAVCKFRIAEIARMAGCTEGQIPDFLCTEERHRGGKGHGRPCAVVKGDRVQRFNSIADAARHLGRRRPTVSRAVGEGRWCGGGAVTL